MHQKKHIIPSEYAAAISMMKPLFIYIGLVYAFGFALMALSKLLMKMEVGEYAKLNEVNLKIKNYQQEIKTLKGELNNIVSRYREMKKSGDGSEDKYATRDLVSQYMKCKSKLFVASDSLLGCKKKMNEYLMRPTIKRDKQVEKLNARLETLEKKIADAKKEVEAAKMMAEYVVDEDTLNLIYEMTFDDAELHNLFEGSDICIQLSDLAYNIFEMVNNANINKDTGYKMLDILSNDHFSVMEMVDDNPTNSVDMQLKIYEACMDGKITEAERDKLLNTINNTDMSISQ